MHKLLYEKENALRISVWKSSIGLFESHEASPNIREKRVNLSTERL